MKGLAIGLALLIVASACVVLWMQKGLTRFDATQQPAPYDDQLRRDAEASGLLPTHGEDDQ